MIIAIAVLVGIVTALVTFISHDAKRNPNRDWHAEEAGESRG